MPDIIAFLSYVLITTFTPGPNNILSMMNAGRVGIRKGSKFNVGIFIGFGIVMLLCGMFGSALIKYMPMIKPMLKYIGVTYILWLAYKTYKSDYHKVEKTEREIYGVTEGLTLQFVNPKVIIYGITTLSTFIVPYYDITMTILFAVGLAGVGFIATICWAVFGTTFHKLLRNYARQVNITMSVILVCTAISLIL